MSIYAGASVNDAAIRAQISILNAKSGAAWRLNWLPESACRKPESVGRKDPYWGYRWGYFWGYRIRYHLRLGIYVASVDPSSATIYLQKFALAAEYAGLRGLHNGIGQVLLEVCVSMRFDCLPCFRPLDMAGDHEISARFDIIRHMPGRRGVAAISGVERISRSDATQLHFHR